MSTKTMTFIAVTLLAIAVATAIALYVVAVSVGTIGKEMREFYDACEPIYCPTTTVIAEE